MPPSSKKKKLPFTLRVQLQSNEAASCETSKKKKGKTQNWRDKLSKTNPQKYKQYKEEAKIYSQYYRLKTSTAEETLKKRNLPTKEREDAELWLLRKKRNNETARIRMKRMKERKEAESTKKGKTKKTLTRQQHEQSKQKEAKKKREQRAGYSAERRDAILARRRELYAMKKKQKKIKECEEQEKILKQKEEELAEREKQFERKCKEVEEKNKQLGNDDALDMRSSRAKCKALERARKGLPRRRSHCINTSIELINKSTPTKKAAFKKAGITSKSKLEECVLNACVEGLKSNKKTSTARKNLATTLSVLKKDKLQRKMCRWAGVSKKLLQNAKKVKAGRKPLPQETVNAVKSFYEENSNQLPDKKLVSKKTFKPRHIMNVTISNLHKEYLKKNPNNPVSSSVFFKLRPNHVKYKTQAKYIGCLCEYCENIQLKIDVINQLQPGTIKDCYHLANLTMCDKGPNAKYHLPDCITRKCSECGVHLIDNIQLDQSELKEIKWKRWDLVESVCYKKETKTVKKRSLVEKSGPISELIAQLKEEVEPFAEHLFNKDWQHEQECDLKAKLDCNEVLAVFDFAENFKCSYQREVQSAYYAHDSATVHPIVAYYKCNACLKLVTESCVFISDDLVHDYHLVNKFQQIITSHLIDTRGISLKTFYRYSDGCSGQYKSKGPISDISYAMEDFGLNIVHNYSGTRHGKGPSDGESGVVKRHASEAINAGAAIINNPNALFRYLRQNLVKEAENGSCCASFLRSIHFVSSNEVDRDRQDRAVTTVAGTRRLHSIKNVSGGIVATRNLSCFCDGCLRGVGKCINELYVHQWRNVDLTKQGKCSRKEGTQKSRNAAAASQCTKPPADIPSTTNHDDGLAIDVMPTNVIADEKQINDIKTNNFVAVKFPEIIKNGKAFVYMAMVTSVHENSQVQLKFMRRVQSGFYDFTSERQATHPLSDVVQSMTDPSIEQVGRRSYLYRFDEKEVDSLSSQFELK